MTAVRLAGHDAGCPATVRLSAQPDSHQSGTICRADAEDLRPRRRPSSSLRRLSVSRWRRGCGHVRLTRWSGSARCSRLGQPLRRAVESGRAGSLVLWGPPGSGKTTLARLIAGASGADVEQLSAVTDGVADLKQAIARARDALEPDGADRRRDPSLVAVAASSVAPARRGRPRQPDRRDEREPVLRHHRAVALSPPDLPPGAAGARTTSWRFCGAHSRTRSAASARSGWTFTDEALELLATLAAGDARTALNALEAAAEATRGAGLTRIEPADRRRGDAGAPGPVRPPGRRSLSNASRRSSRAFVARTQTRRSSGSRR